ncbi:heterokaryon incompatibility protein-domain-containing protein [Lasiosphaeria hispida]|uniref:Heterokaryon incompatibility protein-domain-containing protein n=1 Tax=Lasiosphaeria hispida TaxID=260671 RepID=A0AAJ0HNM7_9PEZI|nr:heterokaryon incompatibility protein-domain-containing protein [Lasiosphaeria hispida]
MNTARCPICKNLCPHGHEQTKRERKEALHLMTKQSKLKDDCIFCDLLGRMVIDFTTNYPEYQNVDLDLSVNLKDGAPAMVQASPARVDSPGIEFCVYVEEQCDELPGLGLLLNPNSTNPGSEDAFQFALAYLDECLDGLHDLCPTAEPGPLPKRVLKLCEDDAHAEEVNLQESNGEVAIYAALSHCWGGMQPIKATTKNLAGLLGRVPWGQLPKVFQDAIRVCRRLGVFYLWIDSLCILQDSMTDWELESAKMGTYYSNAQFTIAAASSPVGTVSFLADRPPEWQPKRFQMTSLHSGTHHIWGQRVTSSQSMMRDDPLASRAWTFQELVLSRRILYYGSAEFVWICKSQIEGLREAVPMAASALWMPYKLAQALHLPGDRGPYSFWMELLRNYCRRNLTFVSDRLPALSGVAAELDRAVKSKYAAGLWLGNMPLDLLWMRDCVGGVADFAPSEYIAPTWSWASITSPIHNPQPSFISLVDILDVHCDVPGLNPYGRVEGGYLDVQVKVAHLRVFCTDPARQKTHQIEISVGELGPVMEPFYQDCLLTGGKADLRRAVQNDTLTPFDTCLPCALIGQEQENSKQFFVLVLGCAAGEYRRLGAAWIASDEMFRTAPLRRIRII